MTRYELPAASGTLTRHLACSWFFVVLVAALPARCERANAPQESAQAAGQSAKRLDTQRSAKGLRARDEVFVPSGELERAVVAKGQPTAVAIAPFFLDAAAVTNDEFLRFLRATPQWRRDKVPSLFADEGMLRAWSGPTTLGGGVHADGPVTSVSWFAARAYCAWRGKRLPTTDEWEYAATPAPAHVVAVREKILAWYAAPPLGRLPPVRSGPADARGIHDLHGLVWEWTEDFDAAFVSADARDGKDDSAVRYCGGAAVDARDPGDYASFMRVAFRSSLSARYGLALLGFRCARDAKETR